MKKSFDNMQIIHTFHIKIVEHCVSLKHTFDIFFNLTGFLMIVETFRHLRVSHMCMHTYCTYTVTFSSGCQRPVGLSRGKAKVCYYSGWYYCQSCHQDNSFLIPARLLHNWDTSKHKVGKHQIPEMKIPTT